MNNKTRRLPAYVIAYLLWVVSTVLGFLAVFVSREAILSIIAIAMLGRYQSTPSEQFYAAMQARAASVWSVVAMGLALIAIVVFVEHLYRTAVSVGRLWERFFLVSAVEWGVLFLAHAISAILAGVVGTFSWGRILILTIELLITALFGWLWRRSVRSKSTAT